MASGSCQRTSIGNHKAVKNCLSISFRFFCFCVFFFFFHRILRLLAFVPHGACIARCRYNACVIVVVLAVVLTLIVAGYVCHIHIHT